jgi:Xaa-Pro aminopeptidase
MRTARVQRLLRAGKIDALLVSAMKNVRYLTGFTGSSGFALITQERQFFYTDFRYTEQAAKEVQGFDRGTDKGDRVRLLRAILKTLGIKRLAFEASLPYGFYERLRSLPATLVPRENIVENLRKRKDGTEIASISKAVERAEKAFLKIKPFVRVGKREREIALRLEEQLKKEGCMSIPFDIIVASGSNSSMPHAQVTQRKIQKGDFVIIDWGGEADGYYSDMTRTLLMGGGDLAAGKRIYCTVNEARRRAIQCVREGVTTRAVDSAARDTIRDAGYGDYFGHGTGHGVGLDVHEGPRVSRAKSEKVSRGMVFTVEPGIYLPGTGGVRIEDMVAVEADRTVLLTTLSRELEIIKT